MPDANARRSSTNLSERVMLSRMLILGGLAAIAFGIVGLATSATSGSGSAPAEWAGVIEIALGAFAWVCATWAAKGALARASLAAAYATILLVLGLAWLVPSRALFIADVMVLPGLLALPYVRGRPLFLLLASACAGAAAVVAIGYLGAPGFIPGGAAALPVTAAPIGLVAFVFVITFQIRQRMEAQGAADRAALANEERHAAMDAIITAYERMPNPFYAMDREWRLLYMNEAGQRQRQSIRWEDEQGRVLWDVFPDLKGTKIETEFRRAMAEQAPVQFEQHYPRMNAWFSISAYPSPDGLSVYFENITARKIAEIEHEKATERQREVEKLKQAEAFRARFVNTAAHELRTPLTPIFLNLHLLETVQSTGLDARQRKAIDVIHRNVKILNRLVNDTLDVARIQAGRFAIQKAPTDLAGLVRSVSEGYIEAARTQGINVECIVLLPARPVMIDSERIEQVLLNLVNNSLKFTPPGGTIRLSARETTEGPEVQVSDTGCGFEEKDMSKMFAAFSQLDSPGRAIGSFSPKGVGLGLFLSKGIIEAHGGHIWCESPGLNRGATFAFVLPDGPEPKVDVPPQVAAERVVLEGRRTAVPVGRSRL
ncbi:MAG: sensor histidine kinase [Thermoplasmatota archaeon]